MPPGEMLRKWLTDNNIPQSSLASRLEVDRSTVHLWIKGTRCPWRKHAHKIQIATGGAIDATLWKSAQ